MKNVAAKTASNCSQFSSNKVNETFSNLPTNFTEIYFLPYRSELDQQKASAVPETETETEETPAEVEGETQPEEEEVDIDLNDPEVNQAAVKIQASYKGFKARKEVQEMKVLNLG